MNRVSTGLEGLSMRFDLTVALVAWGLLRLLALLCCRLWPGGKRAPALPKPSTPQRDPTLCAGLTRTPASV
jgi:hypothetical protein